MGPGETRRTSAASARKHGLGRIAFAAPVAAALTLLGAASAGAVALHGLTPRDCVTAPGDAAGCGATAVGLDDARGVAVSPDGTSVYVVTTGDGAVVHFGRAADGTLSSPSCIEDPEPPSSGCGSSAEGLDGAFAAALSPAGDSLYVVSAGDDAIARFDRAADGTLSSAGCIQDLEASSGCATTAQGLDSPRSLAVSPDGASVYAAGNFDDAIVRFDRDPDGALHDAGCIQDLESTGGCAASTQGLDAARGLVVSPDGANLYVASDVDDKVVTFDRSPSGALSDANCVADAGLTGCASETEGLNGVKAIAISPDGASVHAASITDNALVSFTRAPDGTLSAPSCIMDIGGAQACGASAPGLEDARGVAVSDDGRSVLVAAGDDSAIASFDRAPSGVLSARECIADVGDLAGCGMTAQGLENAQEVAISPDGASVYAVSSTDSAVVRLAREVPPQCRTSSSSGDPDEVQTVPLSCLDLNGDPLVIQLVSAPGHGGLGPIDQATDTVAYTPDPGFTGADSFDIRASAGGKTSNVSTVVVSVQPPTGRQGPTGPQGPPGRDASITCKSKGNGKKKRRIKCSVVFGSARNVQRARLSRAGTTYALGNPKRNRGGKLALHFRVTRPLRPGKYMLTVVQRLDGNRVVTKSRVRVLRVSVAPGSGRRRP